MINAANELNEIIKSAQIKITIVEMLMTVSTCQTNFTNCAHKAGIVSLKNWLNDGNQATCCSLAKIKAINAIEICDLEADSTDCS